MPDSKNLDSKVSSQMLYPTFQHTDDEYLNQVYKTLEWNYQKINFKDLEKKSYWS